MFASGIPDICKQLILVTCCKCYDLAPFVYENRTELLNKFHVPIFMKLFSSLEGLSFDIRHVFERDVYWCASSGICVHYIQRKFSAMYVRDCESFTA